MRCNKNLTDDQLEAMFTATDEEMRKIEQPMKCLKELNTKAEGVPDFPQMKLRSSSTTVNPHCSKTINRANNLVKHLRSLGRLLHTLANDWMVNTSEIDGGGRARGWCTC